MRKNHLCPFDLYIEILNEKSGEYEPYTLTVYVESKDHDLMHEFLEMAGTRDINEIPKQR